MRLILLFLFPFFLVACHQPPVAKVTTPPPVPAEIIATITHAGNHDLAWADLLVIAATTSGHAGSDPDYTKYRYEWNGKMYEGIEKEDIYLTEGDQFVVLLPDTSKPYESRLMLENPVFGEKELITLRAGYVRGSWTKGIVYEYEYNGRRYRKQLYKRDAAFDINGGMTPKQLILVLIDPANPVRSIAVPDEILSREDSVRYSLPHSQPQLNYGMLLSRGVVTGTPDTLVDAVGAYCYVPDTTELNAMKNLVGEWQFSYVKSQRLAVQQQQGKLLRENGVPLYYTHKKKIGLRMPDSSVMILDLAAYQNCCSIALFSGYSPPQVRDGYIDSRAYVYKNYFGGR